MVERAFPALFAALAILVILPWIHAYHRDKLDIFSPTLYKSLFVALGGIDLFNRIYLEERRIIREVSIEFEEGFVLVLGLETTLFAAFLAGYYLMRERPIQSGVFTSADLTRTTLLKAIGVLYILVGAVFYTLALYSTVGTDFFYVYQTTTPRSQLFSDSYIYTAGASMLYLGYFLYLVALLAERRLPNVFELAFLPVIMGMFLLFGGRATTYLIGLTSGIILYYGIILNQAETDSRVITKFRGSHPLIQLSVLPLIVIMAGLGGIIIGTIRGARTIGEAVTEVSPIDTLTAFSQTWAPDNFLLLMDVVPQELGYYYGSFYLRVFTFFIPRSVWEGKPVSYNGGLIRRIASPDRAGGRPAGEIGEYYLNFGLPGIPLIAFIYGMLMRITYATLQGNRMSPIAVLIYALVITSIGNTGLQNLVLTTLVRDLIILSPALLIHTVVAHRSEQYHSGVTAIKRYVMR